MLRLQCSNVRCCCCCPSIPIYGKVGSHLMSFLRGIPPHSPPYLVRGDIFGIYYNGNPPVDSDAEASGYQFNRPTEGWKALVWLVTVEGSNLHFTLEWKSATLTTRLLRHSGIGYHLGMESLGWACDCRGIEPPFHL